MWKILFILIIVALFLLLENYREIHHFKIKDYEIHSAKVKEGSSMNLVFLSDLHNCSYGKNNEELIKAISDLHPDVILVGGDMITRSDSSSFEKAFPTLKMLSVLAPVYYANGNHEQKLKLFPDNYELDYDKFSSFMNECGIILLENKSIKLHICGQKVTITGLEIPVNGYSYFGSQKIDQQELEECIGTPFDDNSFGILLAHNPMHMDLYKSFHPDLILSGHLHGGIVRIPFLGGLIAPDFIPFPRYSGGFYKESSSNIIVSNGLGVHSIPVRLNCPAELLHIIVKH